MNESMALLNSANATADTDAPSIQGASNLQRLRPLGLPTALALQSTKCGICSISVELEGMQVDELRTEGAFHGGCELEACGERSRYAGFMLSKHRVNKKMVLQNLQEAQGLVSMVDYSLDQRYGPLTLCM